jgi:starch phosphorylase
MDKYDPYLLLLDFESYIDCQNRVNDAFLDTDTWTRTAILNVARMGKFSTDRTIKQYSEEIWSIPVK